MLTYLDDVDPEATRHARYRYACFDHEAENNQAYGYAARFALKPSGEEDAVLVGFNNHHGWVTAASNWHEPPQRSRVREGLPGSWEDVFQLDMGQVWIDGEVPETFPSGI